MFTIPINVYWSYFIQLICTHLKFKRLLQIIRCIEDYQRDNCFSKQELWVTMHFRFWLFESNISVVFNNKYFRFQIISLNVYINCTRLCRKTYALCQKRIRVYNYNGLIIENYIKRCINFNGVLFKASVLCYLRLKIYTHFYLRVKAIY